MGQSSQGNGQKYCVSTPHRFNSYTRYVPYFYYSSILAMACLSRARRKYISHFKSPTAALQNMTTAIFSETFVPTQTDFKTVDSELQTGNGNMLQCAFDSMTFSDKVIVTNQKPFYHLCKNFSSQLLFTNEAFSSHFRVSGCCTGYSSFCIALSTRHAKCREGITVKRPVQICKMYRMQRRNGSYSVAFCYSNHDFESV